ncbi:amidohydrolase [Aliibacillus thermotolerans]|uniref:Amidohydrolase n=1 Tax=Aliibacillus thermotolerans TaxID=1834418 RepID=A0ABW0U7M6_9BACI|nr:amidohydrolase [Aliibacillus thermotolerans]MDA3129801.1 amidohydrolase family protein [Aliibacillus thermotolerans]
MGTMWVNGNIYTMEEEGKTVEAVYTSNGIVRATGTKKEIERFLTSDDSVYDLERSTMFPGFTDSHLHMISLGQAMLRLDLSGCKTALEMIERLKEKARTLKPGQWLLGDGWNENNFPDRKILSRKELDDIAPNHPVFLTRICRHAALANSKALELANVTMNTPNPQGGMIERDKDGLPTGYLLDQALELVRKVQPKITDDMLRDALDQAVSVMLQKGLTGGHTEDLSYYGSFHRTFQTFQEVIGQKNRLFRVHLLVHHDILSDMRREGWRHGKVNEYLSFGAVKIFADGALGGRTALLREDYSDQPGNSGVAVYTRDQLKALVKCARNEQMPVAIHAIGDLALEHAVEALEQHPPPPGQRDRIIHAQITPPDLVERLKRLPVVLDIQPHFVLSDFPWVKERLADERISHSYAWKTLLSENILCAGGSDAPIEAVDPLQSIQAAVTRKHRGQLGEGYIPRERLTPYEAVYLYTVGSAQAAGKEKEFGKIAPGYDADFTILEKDILNMNVEDIANVSVVGTVVHGEFQYHKRRSGH